MIFYTTEIHVLCSGHAILKGAPGRRGRAIISQLATPPVAHKALTCPLNNLILGSERFKHKVRPQNGNTGK